MNPEGVLKLWDFLFCCLSVEQSVPSGGSAVTDGGNPEITLAPRLNTSTNVVDINTRGPSKQKQYGCCSDFGVLMNLCGDVMLAMLVSMRGTLLEGDSSECLALLMHFSQSDSLENIMHTALKIRRGMPLLTGDARGGGGTRRASGGDHSSSGGSSAASGGGSGVVKRPSWLGATAAMSTPTHTPSNPYSIRTSTSITAPPQPLQSEPSSAAAGPRRIGSDTAPKSSERSFNEKASRKIQKGFGKLERGVGKLGQKIGEVGVSVGSVMVQTADSLGSRLATNTTTTTTTNSSSSLSSSSSYSSQGAHAQERQAERDLFGNGSPAGVTFTSPTSRALSTPAPALATPARDRARTRAQEKDSATTASNDAIADRLLDIVDSLSSCARTSASTSEQDAIRRAGALKLRLLAALLEGDTFAPITNYDNVAQKQSEVSVGAGTVEKEVVELSPSTPPQLPEVVASASETPAMPMRAQTRPMVSMALYADEEEDGDKKKKKPDDNQESKREVKAAAAISTTSASQDIKEKDKDKSNSADLSFLEEDDDEFLFLSRPKTKPKTSDSVTDDALAMLLGE